MEGCISRKTLWIVSGGTEAIPGIERAKAMGYYVVVSDGNPYAPGFQIADDHIVVSTYDVEGTISEALRYHRTVRALDGIISIASDVPLTVAGVAEALGLPGIPVETARMASDKLLMKDRFRDRGIPIPWYSEVQSFSHLSFIVKDRGLPLIIKPVDSRGARGVLLLTSQVNLLWAYQHSLSHSPSGRLMAEEYLEGPQISTEGIILNGNGYTPGFCDRNYEYLDRFSPYIIENGGQQPSALSPEEVKGVLRLAEDAGKALGVTNGVIKGDMVLTKNGPKVIEIATRLSGGWFSTDQIPLATGVDLIGCAMRLALGEEIDPPELYPRFQKGVAIRYFFPEPGLITHIVKKDGFDKFPWVHRLKFFVKEGDIVEPVTNHTKRTGFVITTGGTREEAVVRAEFIVKSARVETIPVVKSIC